MAIIQDIRREQNQGARVAGSFRDGRHTRYIEVIHEVIVICDSDLHPDSTPVERHRNNDLVGKNFAPRTITTTRSGFDGKLIVCLGGYTNDSGDSRRITVKCDLVIAPEE